MLALMLTVLSGGPSHADDARVTVEVETDGAFVRVIDARTAIHSCSAAKDSCRLQVAPGPALLQAVFDDGKRHERTFRLAPDVDVALSIQEKSEGALIATIIGAAAVIVGFAVLIPISNEGRDEVALLSGLALGSVGALTTLIAAPVYALSGPSLSARRLPRSSAAAGVSVSGHF